MMRSLPRSSGCCSNRTARRIALPISQPTPAEVGRKQECIQRSAGSTGGVCEPAIPVRTRLFIAADVQSSSFVLYRTPHRPSCPIAAAAFAWAPGWASDHHRQRCSESRTRIRVVVTQSIHRHPGQWANARTRPRSPRRVRGPKFSILVNIDLSLRGKESQATAEGPFHRGRSAGEGWC